MLFVHGWPVSGATFRLLLPHLAEHVTCHVIDLPGAGDSRFDADTAITFPQHVESVRRVVDLLGLDDVAVVAHASGGLIARHALAGDPRLRALGLMDTEQPHGLSPLFRAFLATRHLPGLGRMLAWAFTTPAVRRNRFVLGGSFHDRSLLDGDFDAFFLRPLVEVPARRDACVRLLRSFETSYVDDLPQVHQRIGVPVQLVWGEDDPFFPVDWAREMVDTFADARLHAVAGAKLFAHEEHPAEVAAALLEVLSAPRR